MDVNTLRLHMEAAFNAAKLELLPFPSISISKFFPESVYEEIMRLNPFKKNIGKEWSVPRDHHRPGARTPYELRKQIKLSELSECNASDEEREFWGGIHEAFLADDWFFKLVFKAFPAYFHIRFGEAMMWPDLWLKLRKELFLQRHDVNYHIGPHTDVPTRVFTCLFSFAEGDGFEEYGTQILRPLDPSVRCSGRMHHEFAGFEHIRTVPYTANQFFIFFKTRQSFHAVKHLTAGIPNDRYGMQLQCYEPGVGLFSDLSHPDILSPRPILVPQRV